MISFDFLLHNGLNKSIAVVAVFCMNPNGIVVNENTNGIITVNGHSYEGNEKKAYAQQPLLYFYSVTFSRAMKMKSRKSSYSAALYILYISSS